MSTQSMAQCNIYPKRNKCLLMSSLFIYLFMMRDTFDSFLNKQNLRRENGSLHIASVFKSAV